MFLTRCHSGDQIKENEMDGELACMGNGEVNRGFRWRNLRENEHLEDLGVDGRVILK